MNIDDIKNNIQGKQNGLFIYKIELGRKEKKVMENK